VYDWLKHAEATRRTISENYKDKEGEDLLQATIEENVPPSLRTCGLTQSFTPDFTVKSISMPGSITLKRDGLEYDAVRGNAASNAVVRGAC